MNPVEKTVRLYEQNRRALTTAIVKAGGDIAVAEAEHFNDVLITLSLNSIVIAAEYTGEKQV